MAVLTLLLAAVPSCGGGGGGGGSGDGYIRPEQRIAFHTSVTGTGNLSTWADAGGLTGLDAADAVCQARADAAGITGTFVAWASDSVDDAYCRAHGLTGKRSANCGMAVLPAWAGPYVRVDGIPFGSTLDLMLGYEGTVYSGMVLNEFGDIDSDRTYFMTGSNFFGAALDHCANWTTASGSVSIGVNTGTTFRWMGGSGGNCSDPRPLLCLELGAVNEPLPAFAGSGKVVFVTSEYGTGDLGTWAFASGQSGIAAGDAVCRQLAADGGLSNFSNFKAFLSDSTTHAKDRFTENGPYYRTDGMLVAETMSALLNSWLVGSITTDENGDITADTSAWTGTLPSGIKSANACSNWDYGGGAKTGQIGDQTWVDSWWIGYTSYACNNTMHLYCVED